MVKQKRDFSVEGNDFGVMKKIVNLLILKKNRVEVCVFAQATLPLKPTSICIVSRPPEINESVPKMFRYDL